MSEGEARLKDLQSQSEQAVKGMSELEDVFRRLQQVSVLLLLVVVVVVVVVVPYVLTSWYDDVASGDGCKYV